MPVGMRSLELDIRCSVVLATGAECNALLGQMAVPNDWSLGFRADRLAVVERPSGVALGIGCPRCGHRAAPDIWRELIRHKRRQEWLCERCARHLAWFDPQTLKLWMPCRRCRHQVEVKLTDSLPAGRTTAHGT